MKKNVIKNIWGESIRPLEWIMNCDFLIKNIHIHSLDKTKPQESLEYKLDK